jgi:DNA polymerase
MLANTLTLDFESYYDADFSLNRMSSPVYVNDPRFHIHGVALRFPDGTVTFEPDAPAAIADLQRRYGEHLERTTVIIHNGHFDLFILAKRFGCKVRHSIDTLQLAHAVFGRRGEGGQAASLRDLAQHFGLDPKGNIGDLSGVRQLNVQQAAALAAYARHDVELTFQIAERLLPQLSRPGVELRIAAHTLRMHNERGICVDLYSIAPLIAEIQADEREWFKAAGITAEQAASRDDFAEILGAALAKTGRKVPLKESKTGELIPATAKNDAEMQALLEDDDPVVAALARARLAKGSTVQLVARLEKLREIATANHGLLPVHLVYHGAVTGRFAGGGGFNMQNLPKKGFGPKIRALFHPLPGCRFVVVDLAQIEARVLAALAGEQQMLVAFRDGIDIYSIEASAVFQREVRKPTKDDQPQLKMELEGMRAAGKKEVLGLGYQMGALKFMNTLLKEEETAPLFETGALSPSRCVEIVERYRSTYWAIPQYWKDVEAAFRSVVEVGGSARVGHVVFASVEDRVEILLPSGRTLRYPKVRLEEGTGTIRYLDANGEEAEFTRTGTSLVYGSGRPIGIYGGKITENICQAVARDLLVEAILRVEARGIVVVAHIHDEIIAMVPIAEADAALAFVKQEMTRTVSWLPELPLGAEGHVQERLTK